MAALQDAEPWKSLLMRAVEACVAWGAVAVVPDQTTSRVPHLA